MLKCTKVFDYNYKALKENYRYIINQGGTSSSKTFSTLQLLVAISLKYEKKIDVATILIWDISDWLDGLSFFDAGFHDLDEYVSNFRILDSIYKNHKKY